MTSLLDSWAYHMGAENKSKNTISSYRLEYLLKAMGAADEDALLTVDRPTIEKHITEWLGSGLAPATVARRFRSLQQLFRWLDDGARSLVRNRWRR